jgi:hypothetical protein
MVARHRNVFLLRGYVVLETNVKRGEEMNMYQCRHATFAGGIGNFLPAIFTGDMV